VKNLAERKFFSLMSRQILNVFDWKILALGLERSANCLFSSGGRPLPGLPSPPGAPGRGSKDGRANTLLSISTMTIPEIIARENGAFFLDAGGLSV
jgi:hypothetical protein